MSKKEEIPSIIPENERIPALEKEVRYYVSLAPKPKKISTTRHSKTKIETFKDPRDTLSWQLEEIRRCRQGYGGMSGKMYFYFNYCPIINLEEGMIDVEYRVADDDWFEEISSLERGWGLVCVKRRRVGASWKEAADALHDAAFNRFYHIGMNSKTETDSQLLFIKVKFIYDNLPQFLRVRTTAGNTKDTMNFAYYSKDEEGNKIKRGNQSVIKVVAPVVTAFEGWMLNKWICDEAGKQKDLNQMYTYTVDTMMQETQRVGIPIIFGTSGDIGKEGAGLRKMWKDADVYRLKRFFFAGWNGLIVDQYGNDLVEDGIRWILYERHRMESLSAKEYSDFVQKYPLTTAEAFSMPSTGGLGDHIKINEQLNSLRENPPKVMTGSFKLNSSQEVEFVQSPTGIVKMYEPRIEGVKNIWNAGCDPSDHDDVTNEASDLSLIIRRKNYGGMPPQIVLDYTDRPRMAADFYNQALLALLYYNGTKVLIERNRYRMISHFEERGWKHLLSTTPQGIARLVGGRVNTIGLHMNEQTKEYMESLIEEEIDNYHEYIPSEELLMELKKYGAENTDRVMAWGICLIQAMEEFRIKPKETTKQSQFVLPKYQKTPSGKIIRV
jgi:hypothetical protein